MKRSERILTSGQARAQDARAREKFGISTLLLMENAGRAVAEEAFAHSKGKGLIAVFCGKGNNGGDGFCAARHLLALGARPTVFLAGKISDVENEARVNLEILLRLKQRIVQIQKWDIPRLKARVARYSVIIDALLGVGLKGEVRCIYGDCIGVMNASGAYVVSVDIPSGLDATTGKVLGCCVQADTTVTFVARKRGMVFGEGPKYCGKIVVRDIGVPLGVP